jgi:hypothetical protein
MPLRLRIPGSAAPEFRGAGDYPGRGEKNPAPSVFQCALPAGAS